MKQKFIQIVMAISGLGLLANCTTTYDAYGNPQQSVDPGMAAVGVVGAGLVGAAIANNNNRDRHHHHHYRPVRPPHHRHHGGYRPY